MSVRDDISVAWHLSPRVVTVAAPSTALLLQDLHDTLRFIEDQPEHAGFDVLIDSAGKEGIGSGVLVGITASLKNARLAFASRRTPQATGTATTADPAGTTLTDSGAGFVAAGVVPGDTVINFTDRSMATILEVLGATQLVHEPLVDGLDNEWGIGDVYKIYRIHQCGISGGNLVAVDDLDAEIPAVFPTTFTQIEKAAASHSTLVDPATAFIQGQDFDDFQFVMNSSTTHQPQAGLTVSGQRYANGGWQALANSISDAGNGLYVVDLSGAVDLVAKMVTLLFTAPSGDPRLITLAAK